MNTITPLPSIQGAKPVNSEAPPLQRPILAVQSGQLIEALVVAKQNETGIFLQVGAEKFPVDTKVPLKNGETLQLQVISTTPQIQLKILDTPLRQLRGHTLNVLGKSIDIAGIIQSLQRSITTQTSPSGVTTNPQPTVASSSLTSPTTPQQALPAVAVFVQPVSESKQLMLQRGDQQLRVIPQAPISIPAAGKEFQMHLTQLTPPQIQLSAEDQGKTTIITATLATTTLSQRALSSFFQQPGQSLFEILSPQAQQTFNSYLAQQTPPATDKNSGTTLQQLITRLGLAFESQIAQGETDQASRTLKAALMEAAQLSKTKQGSAIHQAISVLELFQLAQLQNTTGQQAIFPLPFSFLEQGYLLVNDDGKHQQQKTAESDSERSFSLYLQMAGLGNIKINFLQSTTGVAIRFDTDSPEKTAFVKGFDQELRDTISQETMQLSFGTEAQDPGSELGKHILGEGETMLDTRV